MEPRADRFRRLLAPHHDRVAGFARSLCRSVSEGDDLFQDAMLHAFQKLDDLREDGAFRTWLYRIVITRHRSRSRRGFWRRLLPMPETPPEAGYRDWSPELAEANRRARHALARLPAEVREAIVLFEIEEWLVADIAALYKTSTSAIKSRLARGREQLRALYEAAPEGIHEPDHA